MDSKTIYEKWEEGDLTVIQPIEIGKMVYNFSVFDVEKRRVGLRVVTMISADGTIVQREYRDGSRKMSDKSTVRFEPREYYKLYDRICECIRTATRCEIPICDCGGELKIYHPLHREEIVWGTMGDGSRCISDVIRDFLSGYKVTFW